MRPVLIIAAILLALGAVEGLAYWWMHPAPAGQGEPVLVYRPQVGPDRRASPLIATGVKSQGTGDSDQGTGASDQENDPAQSPTSTFDVTSSTLDVRSTLTLLPDVYDKAAPMLRCSSGQVFLAKPSDTLSLHLAFFEWNGTDTGSVLEAFRHMPEACMGSIGMKLVSKEKSITYPIGHESLVFDHTVFREPGQSGGGIFSSSPLVHAFRSVWVSGLSSADARKGLAGNGLDHLRTIRLNSALTRFRPAQARVIQGAVRGAVNADAAWQAFEEAMLVDLKFER